MKIKENIILTTLKNNTNKINNQQKLISKNNI